MLENANDNDVGMPKIKTEGHPPMKVTRKMTMDEVVCVIYTVHDMDFDGKLDWIDEYQIDGKAFQKLTHEILKNFGLLSAGM